jgi:hypothetical protein
MKTAVTLTNDAAVALAQYAQLSGRTRAEFAAFLPHLKGVGLLRDYL